ncbi:hypothetical protein FNT36_18335 [Hymenobacter setariae]|uniref:Uncharacterized protein n=1 Tax=Hymenobacter setariae TaxID=2594794 RepID=A0A558BSX9_9BACT|nr:hypothetical protein [Hymenobacter setariae]TVT39601.1 hypothetical protein FNT36_18335 [Hymenobacter setariae]
MTNTHTLIGETATAVGDGWAGFRVGQRYELHVKHREDGAVAIMLDHHGHVTPGAGLVITEEQY